MNSPQQSPKSAGTRLAKKTDLSGKVSFPEEMEGCASQETEGIGASA